MNGETGVQQKGGLDLYQFLYLRDARAKTNLNIHKSFWIQKDWKMLFYNPKKLISTHSKMLAVHLNKLLKDTRRKGKKVQERNVINL